MRKHKSIILAMAIILAIATIASATTFAWFTATDSAVNKLSNGQFSNEGVKIFEVFDEEGGKDFKPGAKVRKDVGAVNTGDQSALVRISFAEVLNKIHDCFTETTPNAANYLKKSTTKFGTTAVTAVNFYGEGTGTVANAYAKFPATIPVLFNAAAYPTSGTNAWAALTSGNFSTVFPGYTVSGTWPNTADVTILYRATPVYDPSTGTLAKTVYNIVYFSTPIAMAAGSDAVYNKYNGKNQKLENLTFNLDQATKTLTLGTFSYLYHDMDLTKAMWPVFTAVNDVPPPIVSAGFPQIKPAAGDIVPAGTISRLDMVKQYIKLIFSANVSSNLASCNQGDWWYNVNDGWFYYVDVLLGGQLTSSMLLNGLYVDPAAKNEYLNDYTAINYDVIVKMQAIQAVDLALESTTGWSMASADATALVARIRGFVGGALEYGQP